MIPLETLERLTYLSGAITYHSPLILYQPKIWECHQMASEASERHFSTCQQPTNQCWFRIFFVSNTKSFIKQSPHRNMEFGNQDLGSWGMVTHVWLQNELPHLPFVTRAVLSQWQFLVLMVESQGTLTFAVSHLDRCQHSPCEPSCLVLSPRVHCFFLELGLLLILAIVHGFNLSWAIKCNLLNIFCDSKIVYLFLLVFRTFSLLIY